MTLQSPTPADAQNAGALSGPPSVQRRGSSWLRRLGSVAVILSLTALGLGAGLWFGTPASAATPPLLVDVHDGIGFTSSPGKLLDVSSLAPGGHVTGTMTVRDDSDSTAGSGLSDTITLGIVDGWTVTDTCAAGCTGAGTALKNTLDFTLTVTRGGTVLVNAQHYSADQLITGVPLASGLVAATDLDVTLTVTLPNGTPAHDNQLQYGSFAFNLGLSITPARDPGNNPPNSPNNPGGVVPGNGTDTSTLPSVEVEGTNAEETGKAGGDTTKPGKKPEVVVLGENKDHLSYTGAPIRMLLVVGGAVLAAGIVLLLLSRGRRRDGKAPTSR